MKTRFLFFSLIFVCFCLTGISQVPKGFNYQAVARDGSGNIIFNQSIQVKIGIQTSLSSGTIYEETFSSITTTQFGLINLVVGSGSATVGTFSNINWNQTLFLKTSVKYPSSNTSWTDMGTSQIWSVPYALIADKANGVNTGTKLSVTSANDAGTDALFEVKRADGQTVFAVYPNAVNVYVPKSTFKGVKGGFAVGGFDQSKAGSPATIQDYLRVTPDSVRIYVDPNPTSTTKGVKGGFAVGGYDESKGINSMYFNLTPNSTVNTVTASPQILWYPKKNAFLAGNIHIGHVDSVGNYSTSLGYQSRAIGDYSQAFGYKATAFGNYSTSIGKKSIAGAYKSKNNAFALGNATQATGEDSYAFGSAAIASGEKSFAFGSVAIDSSGNALTSPTIASGSFSTAIGMGAQATNTGSLAFGNSSISNGYASLALGFYSSVLNTASYGVAIGYYAKSNGYYGQAFGLKAVAGATGSVAIGPYANSAGQYSIAAGPYSSTGSSANYATALGYSAQANGVKSISIGAYYDYYYRRPTFYLDPITHRLIIRYISTHVTKNNIANNDYSVAIGNGNESDNGGFTLGSNNYARSLGAVAIGHSNSADSSYSFAAGYANNSTGIGAFALGENLISQSFHSFVVGDYNVAEGTKDEWITTDPLFVVGNGTGSRSNALVVAKNGNTTINGSLTVTGTITSYVGTGDGLGTHQMNQNLHTNGYYISNDGGNEGLWVSTAGAVGIGNSSPLYMLDVSGSFRSGGSMVASSNLYTYGTLYAYGDLSVSNNLYSTLINPDNNANLTIDAGTLHIDGTNNRVGINNTTPSYGLDVSGTMNVTGTGRFGGDVSLLSSSPAFYLYDTDLNADDFRFEANNDALSIYSQGKLSYLLFTVTSAGAVGMPYVYSQTVGTTNRDLYIDNTGKLGYVSSSLRYKKNIFDAEDISWLYNLRPVTFQYKNSDSDQKQYGLIAEEVLKVNPDFVSFDSAGRPETVSYSALVTPLLKAVQDQKKTIETLQVENSDLKTRLEKLESIVSNLTK
jgi:hypothetical protein